MRYNITYREYGCINCFREGRGLLCQPVPCAKVSQAFHWRLAAVWMRSHLYYLSALSSDAFDLPRWRRLHVRFRSYFPSGSYAAHFAVCCSIACRFVACVIFPKIVLATGIERNKGRLRHLVASLLTCAAFGLTHSLRSWTCCVLYSGRYLIICLTNTQTLAEMTIPLTLHIA